MKRHLALVAAVATLGAAQAHAASVSQTAAVNANIVAANQVTKERDLEFGTIGKPSAGLTTTVKVISDSAPSATPSLTGGDAFIPTTGQAHAAQFRLIGTPNQAYSVTTNSLSFSGAGTNLTNVASENPLSANNSLNKLPATGQDDLYIGGHFDISSSTAVQPYTGTLSLTVNFN